MNRSEKRIFLYFFHELFYYFRIISYLIIQLYEIFPFFQWPFAIFLVTSWFHAHRTSGLYRQKTEPSAISQLHYHWKFYRSRNSPKTEQNSNLMVQGQGYMVDVISLLNQALIIFGEWFKMCVLKRCHGEKLHLYDLSILAVFLSPVRSICSADDSTHSN